MEDIRARRVSAVETRNPDPIPDPNPNANTVSVSRLFGGDVLADENPNPNPNPNANANQYANPNTNTHPDPSRLEAAFWQMKMASLCGSIRSQVRVRVSVGVRVSRVSVRQMKMASLCGSIRSQVRVRVEVRLGLGLG